MIIMKTLPQKMSKLDLFGRSFILRTNCFARSHKVWYYPRERTLDALS